MMRESTRLGILWGYELNIAPTERESLRSTEPPQPEEQFGKVGKAQIVSNCGRVVGLAEKLVTVVEIPSNVLHADSRWRTGLRAETAAPAA
jgi:hypothetical protein